MIKNKIRLNLSRERFNELLRAVVESFNFMQKNYTVSERKNQFVLRTYVSLQRNANLLDCRIHIHSDGNRSDLSITYTPSIFLLFYITFLLLALWLSKAVYSPIDAEKIFFMVMSIALPALFCISEINSYKKFWEYFRRKFIA